MAFARRIRLTFLTITISPDSRHCRQLIPPPERTPDGRVATASADHPSVNHRPLSPCSGNDFRRIQSPLLGPRGVSGPGTAVGADGRRRRGDGLRRSRDHPGYRVGAAGDATGSSSAASLAVFFVLIFPGQSGAIRQPRRRLQPEQRYQPVCASTVSADADRVGPVVDRNPEEQALTLVPVRPKSLTQVARAYRSAVPWSPAETSPSRAASCR